MISEDMIVSHLNMLLTSSDPGDAMHHLHVVAAPMDAVGPLGLVDEDRLHVTVYAIAPTPEVDAETFVAEVIVTAWVEAARAGMEVLFAALSQEMWALSEMDELGRRLLRERRLFEHPNVGELTVVYGASRDGRRWYSRRWLTGAKAGMTEDVELLVGRPGRREGQAIAGAALVRRLVGMTM